MRSTASPQYWHGGKGQDSASLLTCAVTRRSWRASGFEMTSISKQICSNSLNFCLASKTPCAAKRLAAMRPNCYPCPMKLIEFSPPFASRARCVFQTRQGGVSPGPFAEGNIAFSVEDDPHLVLQNRQQLLAALGAPAWAEENQVHGDALVLDAEATDLESSGAVDADGLATSHQGLALMIKTADCQPVLVAHKENKAILALHVGWRGNRIGFIESAIARFCRHYSLLPQDLWAVRGPSLGPGRSQFVNFAAEWGDEFLPWFNSQKSTLDLWALTLHQLGQAGLLAENIFGVDICTFERSELFFSHRRDKGRSGRQAAFIWLT